MLTFATQLRFLDERAMLFALVSSLLARPVVYCGSSLPVLVRVTLNPLWLVAIALGNDPLAVQYVGWTRMFMDGILGETKTSVGDIRGPPHLHPVACATGAFVPFTARSVH